MNRDEIILKLKSLRFLITNLTLTYDMGMQFTILTSDGASENIGNYSDWPVSKYQISDKIRHLISKIGKGEKVGIKDICSSGLCLDLVTSIRNDEDLAPHEKGSKIRSITFAIIKFLKEISLNVDSFYSYITIDKWNTQIKFFCDYESLENFMCKELGADICLYEDMTDDELQYYYDCAAAENWQNLMPYYEQCNEDSK